MAKILQKLWGSIIEFETEDVPLDVRSFNSFGKSTTVWLEQSRLLHRAASYLMVKKSGAKADATTYQLNAPVALMLGGYAVETILKMVVVGNYCDKNGFKFDSKRAKDFLPLTHNLRELAKIAKLRINKVDRELLGGLSKYSIWSGRYPIPSESDSYDIPAVFENITSGKRPVQNTLWARYVLLYQKLDKLAVRKTFQGQYKSSAVRPKKT